MSSIFSLFTAGLTCLLPLASAYTKPVGDSPKGNPILTPGLHDVVPVNEPYTITWDPTTEGTVTILLLKGPSSNAVPQYPIVEGAMNTGNYVWVPSDDLAPGETGYGIQLIVDSTGQYQYSTQFGISNPDYSKGSHGHPGGYQHNSGSSTSSVSASSSVSPAGYSSMVPSGGYAAPTGTGVLPHYNGTAHPTGGWGHGNSTMVKPTGYAKPTMHHTTKVPQSTYAPAPTGAQPSATPTGAASTVATSFLGLVAAAGVAIFAL